MISTGSSTPTKLKGVVDDVINSAAKGAAGAGRQKDGVEKAVEKSTSTAGARFGEGATKPGKNGYTGG